MFMWNIGACQVMAFSETQASLDQHLHCSRLPQQFALLADAHLVVEGQLLPIHKSLLAAGSPVFSDWFLSSAKADSSTDEDCYPMPGHTVADICATLRFLYRRTATQAAETPSKDLWESVADARPITQFAHKFNMQTILQECDMCLSQKAGEADGKLIFRDNDTAVAWAALAEECGLSTLLASAELFMVMNADPEFWQSPVFATHKLSSSCLLRMLRAAQQNMLSWCNNFAVAAPHADWEQARIVMEGYGVADAVHALTQTKSPQPVMLAYPLSPAGSSQALVDALAPLDTPGSLRTDLILRPSALEFAPGLLHMLPVEAEILRTRCCVSVIER